jgi:hypothetical protein
MELALSVVPVLRYISEFTEFMSRKSGMFQNKTGNQPGKNTEKQRARPVDEERKIFYATGE